jgi:hypothetical protein
LDFAIPFSAAYTAERPRTGSATTGAHQLAIPPRYPIAKEQAAPYIGHFQLVKPHGSRLVTGAYVVRFNEFGYLEGSIVVYAYDAIDIISPDNQVIFARLKLRPTGSGRLTGRLIQLLPPGPAQRISLCRRVTPRRSAASPELPAETARRTSGGPDRTPLPAGNRPPARRSLPWCYG